PKRRFDSETHRIYGVMNLGLHKKRYLAGDDYTIADMACFTWAATWRNRDIDLDEFPNVKRWLQEIGDRPVVRRVMDYGADLLNLNENVPADEQARRTKLLAFQRAQTIPPEWG